MNAEFTISAAGPPKYSPRGKPKSALRSQLETLQAGQVLHWRPASLPRMTAPYEIAGSVGKVNGWKFTVRKVDGGHDIYRTA